MNKPHNFIEGLYYPEHKLLEEGLAKEDILYLVARGFIETSTHSYKFSFVGVISLKNHVIIVVPKITTPESSSRKTITLTIQSLRNYSNENSQLYEGIDFFNAEPENPECSEFAIAEFLLKDFEENGLYHSEENLLEINGDGNINWGHTIQSIDPIFSNKNPIYFDTINQVTFSDDNNLILKIHKWSIEYVSKKYATLLGKTELSIPFETIGELNEIGSNDYLLRHLRKQLHITYSDREIHLTKALIFLLNKRMGAIEDDLSLYGTKKYENVWEFICKAVLSKKEALLKNDFFPKPQWSILGTQITSNSTLIPDIVFESNDRLFLFDAKYYNLKLTSEITGIPGYKDVLKQFQYQHHIEDKMEKDVSNAFLFPFSDSEYQELKNNPNTLSYNEDMSVIGYVTYNIKPYDLKHIWIIVCPFQKWQQNYVEHKKITTSNIYWKI